RQRDVRAARKQVQRRGPYKTPRISTDSSVVSPSRRTYFRIVRSSSTRFRGVGAGYPIRILPNILTIFWELSIPWLITRRGGRPRGRGVAGPPVLLAFLFLVCCAVDILSAASAGAAVAFGFFFV